MTRGEGRRAWIIAAPVLALLIWSIVYPNVAVIAGSFENGYDESLATIKGRFWYVGLKKRF